MNPRQSILARHNNKQEINETRMKSKITWIRRSQRVIRMVSELHRLGFQSLRIFPYFYQYREWQVCIAPKLTLADFDPMTPENKGEWVIYSASNEYKYFGWTDVKHDDARGLAEKFITRYPNLVALGQGRDWEYAGWLCELLSVLEHDDGNWLPVLSSDGFLTNFGFFNTSPICDGFCLPMESDFLAPPATKEDKWPYRPAKSGDWEVLLLPERHIVVPLSLGYSKEEMQRIKQGFVPSEMEQKWFIYYDNGILWLHRSWTGFCIYRIHIAPAGDGFCVTFAEINRDKDQYLQADDDYDRKLIAYLIDLILLGKDSSYPESPDSDRDNLIKQWSFSGNGAMSSSGLEAGLHLAMQPNYLGSPQVVSDALVPFFETVIGRRAYLHNKSAPEVTYEDVLNQNKRLSNIFGGLDTEYTYIPGWHTVDQLGQEVIRHFNLDPDYCASEELYFIVTEGLSSVSMTINQLLDAYFKDKTTLWNDALVQLNKLHGFVVAVLMGTYSALYPGKALQDFTWRLKAPLSRDVADISGGSEMPLPNIQTDRKEIVADSPNPKNDTNPEISLKANMKSQHLDAEQNKGSALIDRRKVYHPRPDDKGEPVKIYHPTPLKPMSAFNDPSQYAVMLPDGQSPALLNGIDFQPWQTAPKTLKEWVHVEGQVDMKEPALTPKHGKKLAAGVVTIEPDGRFWLVAPTNAFGGYKATFPKGRLEPGMSLQATAIKEAYEEVGLQVEITGLIGDFERTTTITRYYTARRISGLPTQMDWESQAVLLVPKPQLLKVLNHANDHAVIQALIKLDTTA